MAMDIPTYDQFIHPLLCVLAEHHDGIRARDAYEAVADTVGLTEEARDELLASGQQAIYQNRIGWANDRLKRQRLAMSPKRGEWRITEAGRTFLAAHPDGIDEATLRELTHVERGSQAAPKRKAQQADAEAAASKASPEERIDAAISELNESLSAELLDMIMGATADFFERLVLDILHSMGYGVSRQALDQVGGVGDGGIDGIVTLDRLGLEKVYVQAKRWQGNVGRPEIQAFYGALAGRRAHKGVFITTSDYTADARGFARNVSDAIVLVDGAQLTAFMIEYGVGVSSQRLVKIGRVDSDYFELA